MPPTDSMASAMSRDVRVLVPSSSSLLAIMARPAFSSGSCRAPLSTLTLSETAGIVGLSTRSTISPFGRTWRWTSNDRLLRRSVTFIQVLFFGIARFIVRYDSIRHEIANSTIIGTENAGTYSGYLNRSNRRDARDICIDITQPAKALNLTKEHCLICGAFPRQDEMGLDLMLRTFQFCFGNSIGNDPAQFIVNAGFYLFSSVLATCFRAKVKERGVLRFSVVG